MKRILKLTLIALAAVVACTLWLAFFRVGAPNGIDVSHYNFVNWDAVARNPNLEFVYIKATEGARFRDKKFQSHARQARQKGLHVGAYHYFRTGVTSEKQFENFSRALDKADCDLIPMIDVEEDGNDFTNGKQARTRLKTLIRLIEKKYGVKPIMYYGKATVVPKVIGATYNCKVWARATGYLKYLLPNFSAKQIGYTRINGQTIDLNYCPNISRLMK